MVSLDLAAWWCVWWDGCVASLGSSRTPGGANPAGDGIVTSIAKYEACRGWCWYELGISRMPTSAGRMFFSCLGRRLVGSRWTSAGDLEIAAIGVMSWKMEKRVSLIVLWR